MNLETNKQIATAFFGQITAGDLAAALDTLSDDATWWIAGKPGTAPSAGEHTKEQMSRLLRNMAGHLKNGLTMTVKSVIAEGDQVAVEVESLGELENCRVYNNEYHFRITLRDGKISAIKEYLDTQHVIATWYQP
ncbi:MAG: nuclear transport factor 2 family protein [Rhodospirillales bacterium]|nr:nuclear transport factor 2 family protein [Rhodospirillales bacterium]